MPTGILGDVELGNFALGGLDDITAYGPSQMTATIEQGARLTVWHTASSSSMTVSIT